MKQMPNQRAITIALALVLVCIALTYSYIASTAAESRAMSRVLIATRTIESGTVIESNMLKVGNRSKSTIPQGTATNPEAAVGQIAVRRIVVGSPIALRDLKQQDRLANVVPQYMRAVTVALDPIIGVGGFIKPGDHVDVIATFAVSNNGTVTKTILQNVQLLATGSEVVTSQDYAQTGGGVRSTTQPNATLAVRPTDAEKLFLADAKGKIRLALRRADDISSIRSNGVTGRSVIGIVPPDAPPDKPVQVAVAAAPKLEPQGFIVHEPASLAKMLTGDKPKASPALTSANNADAGTVEIVRGTRIDHIAVHE